MSSIFLPFRLRLQVDVILRSLPIVAYLTHGCDLVKNAGECPAFFIR